MDLGLKSKVALVCGASKGIGYAVAEDLAREGASVAICSREPKALNDAARRLAKLGTDVLPVAADLGSVEGIKSTVARTLERFSRVDVLVTNTGGPPVGTPMGHDWAAWERASELLLRSALELTRAFVPGMRERKWGRVIGITSRAVKQPVAGLVLSNTPAPDWGLMVAEGRDFILNQWWISTFAGLAICIVVLAFNLLGDTLRDIFDPRQYR